MPLPLTTNEVWVDREYEIPILNSSAPQFPLRAESNLTLCSQMAALQQHNCHFWHVHTVHGITPHTK